MARRAARARPARESQEEGAEPREAPVPELPEDASILAGASRDPLPMLSLLREENPLYWIPGLDAWLVTRHEDVRRLFTDRRLTTDPRTHQHYQAPTEPGAARWLSEMPFRSTPSDPESLGRRLVSAALTPRAVERMAEQVADVVEQCAGPLRGRKGRVDLHGEYAVPASATAIGRILGVPAKDDDERRFGMLARSATRAIRPILSDKKRQKMERAGVEVSEYVLSLVEERRREPRADLISDLVAASRDGAAARVEDIVRVVAGLVSAGTGTTATACTRALRALLQNSAELELLRGDRSLLPSAVNELLRYDSGLIVMPRYVAEDFELHGRPFRTGQLVALGLMSANRDPRVFEEPDRLDLRRETKGSLSFGLGPHYCIGSNVARLELRLMLDAALDFLPEDARLLEDEIEWSSRGVMSQIQTLPVDFGR